MRKYVGAGVLLIRYLSCFCINFQYFICYVFLSESGFDICDCVFLHAYSTVCTMGTFYRD